MYINSTYYSVGKYFAIALISIPAPGLGKHKYSSTNLQIDNHDVIPTKLQSDDYDSTALNIDNGN